MSRADLAIILRKEIRRLSTELNTSLEKVEALKVEYNELEHDLDIAREALEWTIVNCRDYDTIVYIEDQINKIKQVIYND